VAVPAPRALPEDLADALSRVAPRLGLIGREVVWYSEVSSTNDVAGSRAEEGSAEGLLVIADMQTSGRGRLGRTWASPPGAGIYASVVFRPTPQAARLLTLAAGVAIGEGIAQATGLETELKWPNDVHCAGRKLAGILAERGADHVVLGFGVNVLQAMYPAEVRSRATSIELELNDGREGAVMAAWRSRAASMLGRRVEWDVSGASQRGLAERVDEDGALLVRTENGLVRVISGEVRWMP
jgi:BirA family transcriptional regulator, biotin operon repressor / biotin---[acetyl-CoA-carboxylase] ligase